MGDTFLDLRGWGKGIVFVNGINGFEMWNEAPPASIAALERAILTELRRVVGEGGIGAR